MRIIVLSVVIPNVITMIVVMLNVIMPNVILTLVLVYCDF